MSKSNRMDSCINSSEWFTSQSVCVAVWLLRSVHSIFMAIELTPLCTTAHSSHSNLLKTSLSLCVPSSGVQFSNSFFCFYFWQRWIHGLELCLLLFNFTQMHTFKCAINLHYTGNDFWLWFVFFSSYHCSYSQFVCRIISMQWPRTITWVAKKKSERKSTTMRVFSFLFVSKMNSFSSH